MIEITFMYYIYTKCTMDLTNQLIKTNESEGRVGLNNFMSKIHDHGIYNVHVYGL